MKKLFIFLVAMAQGAVAYPQESVAVAQTRLAPSLVQSLDGEWLLATDPKNEGRDQQWFKGPQPEAVPAKVPWIIQDTFPRYHGVAWFWREFVPPANPHPHGRSLLRFWGVDFSAEVWLNGVAVGRHEGGETPFVLDVTDSLKVGATNRLAVRVLNPTHQPIDGLVLNQTPHQARVIPYGAGAAYNCGGITESVELLLAPTVRVEDLDAAPDPKTGVIRIEVNVRNATAETARGRLEFTVAPAASGETLQVVALERELAPGDSKNKTEVPIDRPHLWALNDPFLYRVTVRVAAGAAASMDERSVRCGFRDFRFERGCFRLNGRRTFLRSSHTCNHFPVGQRLPHDPDLARRDLLDVKAMGFNCIRFIWGGAERYQLDLCDEIGLMVYEESFASMALEDSPKMPELFDRSVGELIRRDRNHPSIVIWGLLNEAGNNSAFRHATQMLPLVRSLDRVRMVFLNAGRYDGQVAGGSGPFSKVYRWSNAAGGEPWIVLNPESEPIATPFGFGWPPHQVCLHPGANGEFSVARWTAPRSGQVAISARFTGVPKTPATTDVHLLHRGRPLFDSLINVDGHPNSAAYSGRIAVAQGDTVDFVVGFGNQNYGSDTTRLAASLQFDSGAAYDLARDFSHSKNPGASWSYGSMKPGLRPEAATFALYTSGGKQPVFGSVSNPGSTHWEDVLTDMHNYPRVPHTGTIIKSLRTLSGATPVFLSEYGIGSAVDLWRVTRQFERLGKPDAEDAQFYRDKLNRYLADWQRWKLDELFARPEDFFAASVRKMAGQRTLGLTAIRSNPQIIGYSLTGMNDHVSCGEGLTTTFRDLKPGTVDALFEGLAPLRWCLFAEPVNVYRGSKVRLEAILADEDALPPGDYPALVQVIGPDNLRVFERNVTVTIPAPKDGVEPPLAFPVFAEEIPIDGPAGKYRLLATLERGGAPTGGDVEFYLDDPGRLPPVEAEVVLWGEDPSTPKWLAAHQIKTRPFTAGEQKAREVILVGARSPADVAPAFVALARHIARGSTAIFLSPEVFKKGDDKAGNVGWLPLAKKGSLASIVGWLYQKDEWAKEHPIFGGLPAGGLMDYTFYREIIPDAVWMGQEPPREAVAGAIKASQDYSSGLLVTVNDLGAGRFILNTLRIRENLGSHPAADRLLNNLLRFAAGAREKPLADLPADFEAQLKAIGYK
ncbi:MAG: glycoside hydrolase family 2 protein [Limisphaerales bacterium]